MFLAIADAISNSNINYSAGMILYLLWLIPLGINITTLILMYMKKKYFKIWMMITLWLNVIIGIGTSILANSNVDGQIFIALTSGLLWTSYLRISKRVKNTFIR